jgi:hypothetical protein
VQDRTCQLIAFLFVASLMFLSSMTMGQARTEGQLSGKISEPSGTVVAGANLTSSQVSTGISLSATANASCGHVFPIVLPGTYKLAVDAKGINRIRASLIRLKIRSL